MIFKLEENSIKVFSIIILCSGKPYYTGMFAMYLAICQAFNIHITNNNKNYFYLEISCMDKVNASNLCKQKDQHAVPPSHVFSFFFLPRPQQE